MAGNPKYPFKNESQQPMIVMMDHEREVKRAGTGSPSSSSGSKIEDWRGGGTQSTSLYCAPDAEPSL